MRCKGLTKAGKRCKRYVTPGSDFCYIHATQAPADYDHPPDVNRTAIIEWSADTDTDRALAMVRHLRLIADDIVAMRFRRVLGDLVICGDGRDFDTMAPDRG